MVLLSVALSFAFIGALVVTVFVQRLNDRNAREALVANRMAELVLTLESLAPEQQDRFVRDASNRVTTIEIATEPAVLKTPTDDRSRLLANRIAETTGRSDIRASVLSMAAPDVTEDTRNAGLNRGVILVSLALDQDRWLNFSASEPRTWHTRAQRRYLLTVFACSLLIVLGAVWLFLRRVMRPIDELAHAAKSSARGDRSARVSEEGPLEIRQAAKAFNTMQEEICEFDAERMRMMAAVGHDLRTPLTSLRIRAEMVDDDLREPMIATLNEVTAMADGLISYARTGQSEPMTEEVSLHVLLQALCEEFNVSFRASVKPVIHGGSVSLSRAFRNLIENAEAYGESTMVLLSAEAEQAVVTIEDNGPGIEPLLLAKIFDPFVRGDASRNMDKGGVGLGLSIAKEIVIAHGGDLTLSNKPEGGLVARVELPMKF